MITAYTGSPGSGKSLKKAYLVYEAVTTGKTKIIHNKWIDTDLLAKRIGKKHGKDRVSERYLFIDNAVLTPMLLKEYAFKYHVPDKEHQTLMIIEEAADLFDKDEFKNSKYCFSWRKWFREHRQYGFDVILIVQNITLLDPEIRKCIETEVNFRNVKNFKLQGRILSLIFGGFFSYSQRWLATKPSSWEKGGVFVLHRRKAKIYRTMERMRDNPEVVKPDKHAKIGGFADEYQSTLSKRINPVKSIPLSKESPAS